VVQEQNDKNALEIPTFSNYLPSFDNPAYLWLNANNF